MPSCIKCMFWYPISLLLAHLCFTDATLLSIMMVRITVHGVLNDLPSMSATFRVRYGIVNMMHLNISPRFWRTVLRLMYHVRWAWRGGG